MLPPPMSNSSARRSPGFEQRGAALHRQLRLLPRRDDARAEAGLGLHPGEKGGSVRGAAARLRGDRVEAAHGRRASFSAQAASAETARSMALSESRPVAASPSPSRTMRLKLSTTRNAAAMRRRGDQQAAIVGSEVERGVGRRRRRRRADARPRRVRLPLRGGRLPGGGQGGMCRVVGHAAILLPSVPSGRRPSGADRPSFGGRPETASPFPGRLPLGGVAGRARGALAERCRRPAGTAPLGG